MRDSSRLNELRLVCVTELEQILGESTYSTGKFEPALQPTSSRTGEGMYGGLIVQKVRVCRIDSTRAQKPSKK